MDLPQGSVHASAVPKRDERRVTGLLLLSICQISAWGTVIYSFTVLVDPMAAELGWDQAMLIWPFSAALLVSGAMSPLIGEAIERLGSRPVAVLGSAIAALCFISLASVQSHAHYVMTWLVLGLAMEMIFFQPLFAGLVKAGEQDSQRSIAVVTLLTGLSASIFIVVAGILVSWVSWRGAFLTYALLHAAAVVPYLVFLPAGTGSRRRTGRKSASAGPGAAATLRDPRFWTICFVITATNLIATALSVHLIPLMTHSGLDRGDAIAVLALSGPTQFLVRLALLWIGTALTLRTLGLIALGCETAALLCLAAAPSNAYACGAFAVLFGVTSGLMLVVTAVTIRDVFGNASYGRVQGLIMAPAILARSAGPLAMAFLLTVGWGYRVQLLGLAALALASAVLFAVAIGRPEEKHGKQLD